MNVIMSCPKGFLCIAGIDPSGSGECQFKISKKHADHFLDNGPVYKYYEIQSAVEVLKAPNLIFKGLKRDGHGESFCYVGRPRKYGEDWVGPPPIGMVFLVCLTEQLTFFEWRWDKEDGEKAGFPLGSETRFEKLVWKRS